MNRWVGGLGVTLLTGALAGGEPRVLFTRDADVQSEIHRQIEDSRRSIDAAVHGFTLPDLARALAEARERGVAVRVLTDTGRFDGHTSVLPWLVARGVPVRRLAGRIPGGLMHHKFAVFDRRVTLTGSYNWSRSAEHRNYENALLEDRPAVASAYEEEFEQLWREAGSAGAPPFPDGREEGATHRPWLSGWSLLQRSNAWRNASWFSSTSRTKARAFWRKKRGRRASASGVSASGAMR